MATYKQIQGTAVQNYTNDPENSIKGQVWYNETDGDWKVSSVTTVGAWSTGGNLNTARRDGAGAGIQTSALMFAGTGYVGLTESYNGSAWTEVADLNLGRVLLAGTGESNTAALAIGGFSGPPGFLHRSETESWNGTSWTEVNNLNTARYRAAANGTQTSALAYGGNLPPNNTTGQTESWNGTSWTETGDLNTAREGTGGSGSDNTSALSFAGLAPPSVANTESFNGTSWTELNDMNTARFALGGTCSGTNTSALGFGGTPDGTPTIANTESWNGTSWTETTDLNTARAKMGSAGTSTAALAMGGESPGDTAATEEWLGAGATVTKTITTS